MITQQQYLQAIDEIKKRLAQMREVDRLQDLIQNVEARKALPKPQRKTVSGASVTNRSQH